MLTLRKETVHSFVAAGGSNLQLTQFDLKSQYDDRREISFVLEVTTGATAPGASKTLTFNFATVGRPGNGTAYTAAELDTASEVYNFTLPNTTNTRAVFVVPNARAVAPNANYWFDLTAMDSGATLSVRVSAYSNPNT